LFADARYARAGMMAVDRGSRWNWPSASFSVGISVVVFVIAGVMLNAGFAITTTLIAVVALALTCGLVAGRLSVKESA
jgi:hypothetical protein